MSQARLEIKVGMFVFVCLAILAALLLQFSKGVTLFRHTYTIILNANNVGGLRPRAQVLMSGVQVGTVSRTVLTAQGTNVAIYLKIYGQYVIRDDASFKIEASGFLGDQYVAIYPGQSAGQPLANNAIAHADEPFNLQEVARATAGFIQRLDGTVKKVDAAIDEIRRVVLNDTTLTNFAETIANFRQASVDAKATVDDLDEIVKSNGVPAGAAISNLVAFSTQLEAVGNRANDLVTTNGPEITLAISNFQTSTAMLTNLLGDLEAGRGLAGSVLKNEELSGNINTVANNLAVTTSNLNRLGFWHWIWYKPGAPNAPLKSPVYPSAHP
jgi:phospholipid/cholesterol/gamma-HCH transport system substrate-binding protein